MRELTEAEKAVNHDTWTHIHQVRELMYIVLGEISRRALDHDQSKLEDPEVQIFAEYTAKLKDCTYGSDEYKQYLAEMQPALEHHYAKNRHHPEHYKDGVNDMTLIDVLEMLCDWKAASMRHHDGNILKSLEINAERFSMGPQMTKVLQNTVNKYFG
jgi:hypothetical protein